MEVAGPTQEVNIGRTIMPQHMVSPSGTLPSQKYSTTSEKQIVMLALHFIVTGAGSLHPAPAQKEVVHSWNSP